MRRYRRRHPYRGLVPRYRHHDLACVKQLRRRRKAWRRSIDVVANDRPAAGRTMHPQLVGAASDRGEGEPGEHAFPVWRPRARIRPPSREGGASDHRSYSGVGWPSPRSFRFSCLCLPRLLGRVAGGGGGEGRRGPVSASAVAACWSAGESRPRIRPAEGCPPFRPKRRPPQNLPGRQRRQPVRVRLHPPAPGLVEPAKG
jgi:hypothetical protein